MIEYQYDKSSPLSSFKYNPMNLSMFSKLSIQTFIFNSRPKILIHDNANDNTNDHTNYDKKIEIHTDIQSNSKKIKEIYIPFDEKLVEVLTTIYGAKEIFHRFYVINDIGIRLVPTTDTFCVTFFNDKNQKQLITNISKEKILDQTIVSLDSKVEIRYDDNERFLPFYTSPSFSILENTIDELQSPSVLGSKVDHLEELKNRKDNHCWAGITIIITIIIITGFITMIIRGTSNGKEAIKINSGYHYNRQVH